MNVKESWWKRPLFVYLAAGWFVGAYSLLIYHWVSGEMPSRVAFRIDPFDLDVYWYGIIATFALLVGVHLVQHMATVRGKELMWQELDRKWGDEAATAVALPEEIGARLRGRRFRTVADLVWYTGLQSTDIGLNKDGLALLQKSVEAHIGLEEGALDNASWRKWDPDFIWRAIPWVIVLTVIGARLYHVLTPSPSMAAVGIHSPIDYFRSPMRLINLRNGGLGLYGGIIGGIFGLSIACWRGKMKVQQWLDLTAVAMPLGQSIGRWGNFLNQELYGGPTDRWWGIGIDGGHRLDEYVGNGRFHPTFLYESILNLLLFTLLYQLYWRFNKRVASGSFLPFYLAGYALVRIFTELFRLDSRTAWFGLPTASWVSIGMILFSFAYFYWLNRSDSTLA